MTPEQEHQIGRCIFREAYDAFLIVHPADLQVVEANPAVQRLTGRRRKQLLGAALQDLVEAQAPEQLHELIRACQTTSYFTAGEGYQIRGVQHNIPVHITVSRIHLDPEPLALLIVRDMTERRQAEQALRASQVELRALFDAEPECVKLLTEHGELVDMNASGLAMIDADSLEQVKGQCIFPLVVDEHRTQFVDTVRRACRGEPARMEFQIVGLKGTRRWVETNIVAFPRSTATPMALGITRDITQRKAAEEALRRREAELLHASRLSTVGQMVAVLSHEVAQPLNAIGNFAAACSMALDAPREGDLDSVREYVQAIARESDRCRAILQRLRDFIGRPALVLESCDLNDVLRESVELVRHDLRRHQVGIDFALAPLLPPIVADRVQLQQVVVNLLNNARDAVQPQPPERRIVTLRSESEAGSLVFEVMDEGSGFDEEAARRLFEPFFTTKENGMGLGLNICRTIVANHGGSIEASRRSAGGTTFRVRLPLAENAS